MGSSLIRKKHLVGERNGIIRLHDKHCNSGIMQLCAVKTIEFSTYPFAAVSNVAPTILDAIRTLFDRRCFFAFFEIDIHVLTQYEHKSER